MGTVRRIYTNLHVHSVYLLPCRWWTLCVRRSCVVNAILYEWVQDEVRTLVLLKFEHLLKVSYRKLRFVIAVCNCILFCHQDITEISKLFFIHVLCRTSQRAHSPGNALKHTPGQYVSTGTTGWVIAVQWVSAQEAKFEQFGWVAYIYIRNNPPGTAHDD